MNVPSFPTADTTPASPEACPASPDGHCPLRDDWCAVGMCRDERRARLMRRLFYPTGERREDGDPWELADVSFLVGFSHERVREEILYGTLRAFRLRRTYLVRQPNLIHWLEAIGFLERRHPGDRRQADRGEDRRTTP